MSLGEVFDRIEADVVAQLAASHDPQRLGVELCNSYYYLLSPSDGARVPLLHAQTSLQELQYPQDATLLSFWVRVIVGCAVAGMAEPVQIEARYLLLFAL